MFKNIKLLISKSVIAISIFYQYFPDGIDWNAMKRWLKCQWHGLQKSIFLHDPGEMRGREFEKIALTYSFLLYYFKLFINILNMSRWLFLFDFCTYKKRLLLKWGNGTQDPKEALALHGKKDTYSTVSRKEAEYMGSNAGRMIDLVVKKWNKINMGWRNDKRLLKAWGLIEFEEWKALQGFQYYKWVCVGRKCYWQDH